MSDSNNKTEIKPHISPLNPALKRLDKLVGEWNVEISYRSDPSNIIRGRTSFEWLGNGFIVQRSEVERPEFPKGIAIIGGEDATDIFPMHYFDSRGVVRLYQMTLDNGVWKTWRDDPVFSQRFMGTFSDDGNTITCILEKSGDGINWEHDFDQTYRKLK
jgi:hypothetical protein